jgi:hypothetical protein
LTSPMVKRNSCRLSKTNGRAESTRHSEAKRGHGVRSCLLPEGMGSGLAFCLPRDFRISCGTERLTSGVGLASSAGSRQARGKRGVRASAGSGRMGSRKNGVTEEWGHGRMGSGRMGSGRMGSKNGVEECAKNGVRSSFVASSGKPSMLRC